MMIRSRNPIQTQSAFPVQKISPNSMTINFRLLPIALSLVAAHAAELPKPEITI